jgi:acid phosphatase type 7
MFFILLNIFINLSLAKTSLLVISDLNGSYGSTEYSKDVHRAVEFIVQEKPDLVISTGDMIAGQKSGLDYLAMWNAFHQTVTLPLTQNNIALAVTPGNHDASAYTTFSLERTIYQQQWLDYRPAIDMLDDMHYPLYYAFSKNNILFISLDATMTNALDNQQMQWLEKVLDRHQSYITKIIFGHMPLFPVAQNREADYLADKSLHALFKKYHISLYLSGHHHAFYPGVENSIHQVSQACLGGGARKLIGDHVVAKKSITRIEINQNGSIKVDAFLAPDFKHVLDQNSLPEKIGNLIRF